MTEQPTQTHENVMYFAQPRMNDTIWVKDIAGKMIEAKVLLRVDENDLWVQHRDGHSTATLRDKKWCLK